MREGDLKTINALKKEVETLKGKLSVFERDAFAIEIAGVDVWENNFVTGKLLVPIEDCSKVWNIVRMNYQKIYQKPCIRFTLRI